LYKIAFIADGPLCAQYHPRREREDEAVPVEVVAGDTVLTWFTPKPAGSISGVLSDAGSGESIAGASLRAVELHTRLISRAITADDGSFSFRRVRVPGNHGLDSGLPPGRWRIQADTTVAPGPSSTPILAASIAATPEGSGSVRVCWSLPAGGPWFYQLVRRFADEAEPAPGVEVLLAGRAVYDSVEVHHDAPARGDGALAQYGLRFAASEEALAAEGGNAVGPVWITWAEPVHLGGTAAGEPRQRLAARPVPWNGQGEVVISLLPVASTVDEGSLSIYDPGGRELNRLRWPAGARSVSWNGLDDQGRKISSRFVLLRLHGRKTASGSLALIR
jgi:hypothetical protein